MSEITALHKSKSQSFSDLNQLKARASMINPRSFISNHPFPQSQPRKSESKEDLRQESTKNLILAKLFIKSTQKSQKSLGCNLRSIKTSQNSEPNSPFFKFLSDETIDYTAMTEQEVLNHNDKIYKEHLKQTFYSMKIVKNLQKYQNLCLRQEQIKLPVLFPNRKTLIFDLDETLVHCMGQRKGHISVKILFPDSRECFAGINLRPYLAECLEAASQLFEVVVFTASRKFYADAVINHIDPEQKYFHHRLYSDSCVKYGNFNVKDLRLLNRRLQDVVIVDNSIFSFAFQLDNGVPIIPWVNDPLDTELKQLIEYFNAVNEVADVREFNRRLFGLDSFYDDYFEEYGNK